MYTPVFYHMLQYVSGLSALALNWQFLTKIWKPDTVFLNGQRCYLHKITVPNRFIRVFPDGKVSYSQVGSSSGCQVSLFCYRDSLCGPGVPCISASIPLTPRAVLSSLAHSATPPRPRGQYFAENGTSVAENVLIIFRQL